jgi:uncharacterized protein
LKENDAITLLISSGCSPHVVEHCKTVAQHARKIALDINRCAQKRGTSINVDVDAVFLGGLLHDIGRSKTHGIDHAVKGARIAIENGLGDKLVNIIERHIGAGITREEAVAFGLPARDYLPVTLEEKIVAHADNLVDGSRVGTMDELVLILKEKKFDEKIIKRFIGLNNEINSMVC